MSVAKLNVEIGSSIAGLQKGLRGAEREMRRSGRQLAAVANEMASTFSLALGGLGAFAIQTAGDMQALKLAMQSTFKSAGRSIEEANNELTALRKAALAPGLDFEQAVRGSVRLQNVGFSAERAREILVQLANAIAMTGGTAQELDGVTRQFTQMIAKGRVMQEDLTIIQENMPAISAAMDEAFGTRSAEKLREMGITAEQFIEGVTKQLSKLPRVQGGIANAIVNAWSAVKNAAADLGEEIDRVFNIGQKSEDFSRALSGIVGWFKELDDSTKKLIVTTGLYVVAAGPVVKVLGAIQSTGALVIGAFNSLIGIAKGGIGSILGMANALNSIRSALVLIGGGVALAAISAIAGSVFLFAKNTDAAAIASKEFGKAQVETNRLYAEQTAELNKNFATLKNVNATTEERKMAIAALQAAYPDYLKNINLETASSDKLTEVQGRLNNAILRGVAERQKAIAVTAIYEKQAQLLLRIQQLRDGGKATPGEATLIDTGEMVRAGGITAAVIKKMEQQAQSLEVQARKVGDEFDRTFGLSTAPRRFTPLHDLKTATEAAAPPVADLADKTEKSTQKVKAAEIAYDGAARRVGQMADAMLRLKEVQAAFNFAKPLQALPSGGGLGSTESGTSLAPVESLTAANEQLARTQQILAGLQNTASAATKPISTMAEAILAAGQAMSDAAASGESSFKALAGSAVASAAKVVRAWIQQGVAAAVAKALSGIPFPFNIAAGLAAGGLAAGLFNKLLSGLKVPGFAQGTTNAPGGLAMVGERGPELVSLPRASQVVPNPKLRSLAGGGDVNVSGTFRVRGSDLLLVLEREQKQAQRTRGY